MAAPVSHGRHSLLQAHRHELGILAPEPDAESRPIVDKFVFLYWGLVVLLVVVVVWLVIPWLYPDAEDEEKQTSARRENVFGQLDENQDGGIDREEFLRNEQTLRPEDSEGVGNPLLSAPKERESSMMAPKEVNLPATMWSLNIVASIGQAKVRDKHISAVTIGVLTLFMAFLQMFALFLVVHDINPDVDPVTIKPSSPWIKSGWSVNCMKWLMVTFMSMLMITEAGECRTILTCILETNNHRLREPRWFLMGVCFFQYIIMVFVIWGGVAAVLSFQSVPDILYSSMSITYIAKVDEAFFTMLYQIFQLEADFTVVHGRKVAKMTSESLFAALDADGDGHITRDEFDEFQDEQMKMMLDEKLRPEKLSQATEVFLHFLAAFPCLLGFALIGRAFYTNVMPTDRFHDIATAVKSIFRSA